MIRFLATGNSCRSLAFDFRVSYNTISLFKPEVCDAIVTEFKDQVINTPSTPDAWTDVANKFGLRWNFYHACGALDGKDIAIKKPRRSGSLYHNYKGFFSIVLLGLVNADYKFLWVHIGSSGSSSDCGVFNRSSLEPALREGTLGLPQPQPLPQDDKDTPFFVVGDDAFPLRTYLIKSFPYRFFKPKIKGSSITAVPGLDVLWKTPLEFLQGGLGVFTPPFRQPQQTLRRLQKPA